MPAAGPSRSSIWASRPAFCQYSRASAVQSALTSQHSRLPPGASPRARQMAEYPVNVPTSTARRGAASRLSSVMNVPCSGPICRWAHSGKRRDVSARSSFRTGSGGLECDMTYS